MVRLTYDRNSQSFLESEAGRPEELGGSGEFMTSKEDLTKTIIRVIQNTLAEKGIQTNSLGSDSSIDQTLGLDSLDWAAIVVRLEEETGIDPFQQGLATEMQTVGDLVDVYASAKR